ncbi:DNA polymerase III subunit chi [Marinobacter sp. BGYM27]|uniref:DNA polymerase III subunit chi n=1 Tax=Marinobacter sp. BGYM27 TaxID=2975597 RepID=UPI0021A26BF3|nr:DNA polymerase III subunit chi [Marinobacter sp. BGYM27]MDG5498829.1 DNA polymerase III subunit chi [Marinobacter sp. BGYM27]
MSEHSPQSTSTGQHRHWFYLIPQDTESARLLYAARLTEKAYKQGDRVCLMCNPGEQIQALDRVLWQFSPDSFIPHTLMDSAVAPGSQPEKVGLVSGQPSPADWDTVIVLGASLPAEADRFARLALIASSDAATLNQARGHFRQLRELGIQPQVHDARKSRS